MFLQFGPSPGKDSGGIINRVCDAVMLPANGMCETGWEYSSEERWEVNDKTIFLTCERQGQKSLAEILRHSAYLHHK